VGQSGTFCVKRECTVKHQGEVADIHPWDIYISTSKGEIGFLSPKLSASQVSSSLLSYMATSLMTLEKWHELFNQVQYCYDPVNHDKKVGEDKFFPVKLFDIKE